MLTQDSRSHGLKPEKRYWAVGRDPGVREKRRAIWGLDWGLVVKREG